MLLAHPPAAEDVIQDVYEGCTFREVAEMSGESINTIASRYRYALARMREVLTP